MKNIDKVMSKKHPGITIIGNVLDKDLLIEQIKNSNCVVLLAAEHKNNVSPTSLYYDVNVQGMRNTLDAMNINGIKNIIFTSPTEETTPAPFNHYGKSKWEAEKILQKWAKDDLTRNALIIRPTVIFGEGNRGNVFNLLNQVYSKKFLMVGKGNNKKSMCYVRNIIAFIKQKMEQGFKGLEIYNFKDQPDLTMKELVDLVYSFKGDMPSSSFSIPYPVGLMAGYVFDFLSFVSRRSLPISSVRIKKFCATTSFNSDKLKQSGFKHPFTLKDALKKTLEYDFGESKFKHS